MIRITIEPKDVVIEYIDTDELLRTFPIVHYDFEYTDQMVIITPKGNSLPYWNYSGNYILQYNHLVDESAKTKNK